MQIRSISLIVLIFFSSVCFSNKQISFLNHQEKLNSSLCDTLVSCRKGSTKNQCLNHMNALSQANPNNKKVMVYQDASQACIDSLTNITCKNALEKSIHGPCALKALQSELVNSKPVTIKDEKSLPKLSQQPKPSKPDIKASDIANKTTVTPSTSILPQKPPQLVRQDTSLEKPKESLKPQALPDIEKQEINLNLQKGDKAKVEFNNKWYPAIVLQAKLANKHRFYQIKFIQSGIEAWVAPNRIIAFKALAPSNKVGESSYSGHFSLGKKIRAEYDGKWYPAVLLEKKQYLETTTYKIQYKTNGIVEWVAGNRIKDE